MANLKLFTLAGGFGSKLYLPHFIFEKAFCDQINRFFLYSSDVRRRNDYNVTKLEA